MWEDILEIAFWLGVSIVKFLAAPAMHYAGYNFWQTVLIAISGGTLGVFIFYYAGGALFDYLAARAHARAQKGKKAKKKFTRRNKILISVKSRFGLYGLAFITPIILSIPVGSLLAARYYPTPGRAIPALIASVVFWAFILTIFYDGVNAIIDSIKEVI